MRIVGLISLVNLLLGLAGLRKALRENRPADIPRIPGLPVDPEKPLSRRHWSEGTELSAPTPMLIVQGIATLGLLVAPRPPVLLARVLGVLGAAMAIGWPIERVWRESLVEPDTEVTPLTVGGFLLSIKLAILGWSVGR